MYHTVTSDSLRIPLSLLLSGHPELIFHNQNDWSLKLTTGSILVVDCPSMPSLCTLTFH